ncbi:MAG: HlyD family efflux transporter periplasmic adaptor subunit [Thalassovita sp.]
MRVEHTSPSPDLDLKVSAALCLETPQGDIVRVERWSLAALVWPEDGPECPATGTLSVPFQGVDVRFPVRLERIEDSNDIAFKGLSGRQRETLALFYRSLLSGRMVASEDVIKSLDTPLDLVPMGETESEKSAATAGRWRHAKVLRAVIHVATYVACMALVVGVVGSNILTNLDRIDIRHGRVQAPIQTLVSLRDSYVGKILVAPGDRVKAGDVLISMSDPAVTAKLSEARSRLSDATRHRNTLTRALTELEKLRHEPADEIRMAGAGRIYEAHVARRGFGDLLWQWDELKQQDLVAANEYDPVEVTYRLVQAQLSEKQLLVKTLRARRDGQKGLAAATDVVADTDGVVGDVLVRQGQFLAQGVPVVTLEQDAMRDVVGWASERYAQTIHVGMPARIGVNSRGEKQVLRAVVTDVAAGGIPERPGEYGIVVTVQPISLSVADSRQILAQGAPVKLEAERRILDRMKASALTWLPWSTPPEDGDV